MRMLVRQCREFRWFLALLIFLLASVLLLEGTKTQVQKENCALMLDAARRTEKSFAAVREERLARGCTISTAEDINQTGLIGDSYSEITTTLGSLESKRSSVNPNIAAMIVDMLTQCGVTTGDPVAVNLSSSFPALNLSVLCALDAVGAKGIIINSVGASTYGANLPEFTYLDMEHILLEQHLISNHSQWFSLGGDGDIGSNMSKETVSSITKRLTGFGLTFLYYEELKENLLARLDIYESQALAVSGKRPVCFINAGGNLLSFGSGEGMVTAENGILRSKHNKTGSLAKTGLIPFYLKQDVPVIHLLNLKTLLPAYGLPFDPSPVPAPGKGGVYMEWHYSRPLALSLFLAALWLLIRAGKSRRQNKRTLANSDILR